MIDLFVLSFPSFLLSFLLFSPFLPSFLSFPSFFSLLLSFLSFTILRHERDREHDRERKPRSYFSRSAHEDVKNEMRAAEERLQAQWPTTGDIKADKATSQLPQPTTQVPQQQQQPQQQQPLAPQHPQQTSKP